MDRAGRVSSQTVGQTRFLFLQVSNFKPKIYFILHFGHKILRKLRTQATNPVKQFDRGSITLWTTNSTSLELFSPNYASKSDRISANRYRFGPYDLYRLVVPRVLQWFDRFLKGFRIFDAVFALGENFDSVESWISCSQIAVVSFSSKIVFFFCSICLNFVKIEVFCSWILVKVWHCSCWLCS